MRYPHVTAEASSGFGYHGVLEGYPFPLYTSFIFGMKSLLDMRDCSQFRDMSMNRTFLRHVAHMTLVEDIPKTDVASTSLPISHTIPSDFTNSSAII